MQCVDIGAVRVHDALQARLLRRVPCLSDCLRRVEQVRKEAQLRVQCLVRVLSHDLASASCHDAPATVHAGHVARGTARRLAARRDASVVLSDVRADSELQLHDKRRPRPRRMARLTREPGGLASGAVGEGPHT